MVLVAAVHTTTAWVGPKRTHGCACVWGTRGSAVLVVVVATERDSTSNIGNEVSLNQVEARPPAVKFCQILPPSWARAPSVKFLSNSCQILASLGPYSHPMCMTFGVSVTQL